MTEQSAVRQRIPSEVSMQWAVKIPLRDGIHLTATVYLPKNHSKPSPAVFTLTPYSRQAYHDQGMYFAAHGYPFLTVDVRGRGDSEGVFKPLINEAQDGFDLIEWLARQVYCNGQVAMWGGSYAGSVQWAAASKHPPHLATIVPVASPYASVDWPMRGNVPRPHLIRWATLISGRGAQDKVFADQSFWSGKFKQLFEAGMRFTELDALSGNPSDIFQELISHPQQDAYWDQYNPQPQEYARISMPVLTITGIYDGDQLGALMHYREHLNNSPAANRVRHHLVIGPWDHAGTRVPAAHFCGLKVGPASLVDLPKLHLEWYAWTLQGGPRPQFLRKNVVYYVMVAEKWRYADTLEAVTSKSVPFHLQSLGNPTDVLSAGSLVPEVAAKGGPDRYTYDPRDIALADLESTVDPESRADQRMIYAAVGKQLIYHSAPFEQDMEISGFFKLCAWLAIDQHDTDFRASVYDVDLDGSSILLTSDWIRARYRESLREARLIHTKDPLRYDFERFMFVARVLRKGHRLRLTLGPVNSIYCQKNFNSGGVVADESVNDARTVTVELFHDELHPSVLHVPFGQCETQE